MQEMTLSSPPVVAVMVIHEPGDWLVDSLRALVDQEYEGLQVLLLVTGTSEGQSARAVLDMIETHAPQAVVRFLGSNPGYGSSCNAVLNLVQGENGLFCFLHDDVALEPHAISEMVVELYRSNAGAVGPKLVYWDDSSMIQSVGAAVDRFGVTLPYADIGEKDQEQHDAVQDVFVLSSACLMIRADLFRAIGGFDVRVDSSGHDLDLCWRIHISGARVVIVPSARARHRESMTQREDALEADAVIDTTERERTQTVASLTTARQLPLVLLSMFFFTLARSLLLLVTGRARRAVVETGAVLSLPRSITEISARRRAVRAYRAVFSDDIRALQLRGLSYVTATLRRRAREAGLAQSQSVDDVVERQPKGSYILWGILVAVLVVGSRSILLNGVAPVGQMVPFHESARSTFESYVSGWWSAGFGQVSALPTGVVLSAISVFIAFGQSGLAHTLAVLVLPLVGWLGVWRLASLFGTRAGRLGAVAAYAAVPLPYVAIASGRWSALLVYGFFPWMIHLLRMLVGHADIHELRPSESMVLVSPRVWRRWFSLLVLLVAIVAAFEPSIVGLLPVAVVFLSVAMLVQGLHVKWIARWIGITALAVVLAIAINLPWSITYVRDGWWEAVFGAPVESGRDIGLWKLMTFDLGQFWMSSVVIGLYGAVIGAVLLVRGARAQWALRGATMVGATLLLAITDDAGLLPLHLPEPGIVLVPMAVGMSLCAGAMAASLATDFSRTRLSWRQPLGALVAITFVLGLFPVALNAVQGKWHQPSLTMTQLLAQLPDPAEEGDYRTLFIGDSRVLPGAPLGFGWGISFSVVNGPTPVIDEYWELPETKVRENLASAMYGIVRGQTARAGRLLGPLSVRYIVVPFVDGAQSTRNSPIAPPLGLVDSLSRQLDLKRKFASPDLVVFENSAWVPVRSVLTEVGAQNSQLAGARSMITADIAGATALPAVEHGQQSVVADVAAGTVHLAMPFTSQWKIELNGQSIPSRPAFGLTNAYDIPNEGTVEIFYSTSPLHSLLVAVQFVSWAVLVYFAVSRRRRRERVTHTDNVVANDEPIITMQPVDQP